MVPVFATADATILHLDRQNHAFHLIIGTREVGEIVTVHEPRAHMRQHASADEPLRRCSSSVRSSASRKQDKRPRYASNRLPTSAFLLSSGCFAQDPSKICSASTTHSRILLIALSASFCSSCKLTMVLRRLRRCLQVWFTAPPLFPASPGSSGSCSTPLASAVLRSQTA